MGDPRPVLLLLLVFLANNTLADLPVHCLKHHVVGTWIFQLSQPSTSTCLHTRPDNIIQVLPYFHKPPFPTHLSGNFSLPSALTSNGTLCLSGSCEPAHWTMIYDEGVSLTGLHTGLSLTMDFAYYPVNVHLADPSDLSQWHSFCGQTYPGWYKSSSSQGCVVARNLAPPPPHLSSTSSAPSSIASLLKQKLSSIQSTQIDFVRIAASVASSSFQVSPESASVFAGLVPEQVLNMFGGPRPKLLAHMPNSSFSSSDSLRRECMIQVLPPALDYSQSPISTPVINQGDCGSCWAVSAADALTMRFRLALNSSAARPFSYEHMLQCSPQNQGCSGGYPFLAAYFSFYNGLVTCPPPAASLPVRPLFGPIPTCDSPCGPSTPLFSFGYVGGSYGRGNEADMLWSLNRDGPLVVAINPSSAAAAFTVYKSGVFVLNETAPPGNQTIFPGFHWERTTHAVVLMGYGQVQYDGKTVPTWRLKNSWGSAWGEQGYFTIQRGVDAMAVESMPVHFSFQKRPGNPHFESQVRSRLPQLAAECAPIIEDMLAQSHAPGD